MTKYNRKDHYYKKAKEEGYRSRASYKLLDIDKKFKILKKGMSVLDLGCFPGGWLQVACEKVSSTGKVVGIDLDKLEPFSRSDFHLEDFSFPIVFSADITSEEAREKLLKESPDAYNVLLSDMSPKLSGIRVRDMARMEELVRIVFEMTSVYLKKGGSLVVKVFPSEEIDQIFNEYKGRFKNIKRENVSSSRNSSNEYYLIARGFQGPQK